MSDLFSRLQRAEWALATARRRAATWGFERMVPEGRADRGVQTAPAEVWASAQCTLTSGCGEPAAVDSTASAAAAAGDLGGAAREDAVLLPPLGAVAPLLGGAGGAAKTAPLASGPGRGCGKASSPVHVPASAMSATTLRRGLGQVPGLAADAGAATGGHPATDDLQDTGRWDGGASSGTVQRVRPAFADHWMPTGTGAGRAVSRSQRRERSSSPRRSAAPAAQQVNGVRDAVPAIGLHWRAAVAARLLAAQQAASGAAATEAGAVTEVRPSTASSDGSVADQRAQLPPLAPAAAAGGVRGLGPLPPVLPPRALLALLAELLGAKARADAAALAAGRPAVVGGSAGADDLAEFALKHFARRGLAAVQGGSCGGGAGTLGGAARAVPGDCGLAAPSALDALAQLVASVRAHAGSLREAARFRKALGVLGPLDGLAAPTAGVGGAASSDGGGGGGGGAGHDGAAPLSCLTTARSQAGTQPACHISGAGGASASSTSMVLPHRRRARAAGALAPDVALPADVAAALAEVAARPGAGALLEWAASGAFLGHVRGANNALGRPLLDVQARAAAAVCPGGKARGVAPRARRVARACARHLCVAATPCAPRAGVCRVPPRRRPACTRQRRRTRPGGARPRPLTAAGARASPAAGRRVRGAGPAGGAACARQAS